jgi:hypothetical protein
MIFKRIVPLVAGTRVTIATAESVVVVNSGPSPVYVGAVDVSVADGLEIDPNKDLSFDLRVNEPLYAISPANGEVTVLQTGPTDPKQVPITLGLEVAPVAHSVPYPIAAHVDGTTLIVTFNESLDNSSVPAASTFSVVGAGSGVIAVDGAVVAGQLVTLALHSGVFPAEAVRLTYAAPNLNPIRSLDDHTNAASFGPVGVVNDTAGTYPTGGSGPEADFVSTTRANLNTISLASRHNGSSARIELGIWPDENYEELSYRATQNIWLGETKTIMKQNDRWSMDLGDKPEAIRSTQWNWLTKPNPNGYRGYVLLDGSHDFTTAAFTGGTGVVNVLLDPQHQMGQFDPAGTIYVNDNRITYTGKVTVNATHGQFTGCTRTLGGSVATDKADVLQGTDGGWGTVSVVLPFAAEMIAAGFTLQERARALMNANNDVAPKHIVAAPAWYQYNDGDGSIAPVGGNPPTASIGVSATLTGTNTVPSGIVKPNERPFVWAKNDWTDFPALTITKRFIQPRLFAKMEAGALDTGQVLDYTLEMRWVGAGS